MTQGVEACAGAACHADRPTPETLAEGKESRGSFAGVLWKMGKCTSRIRYAARRVWRSLARITPTQASCSLEGRSHAARGARGVRRISGARSSGWVPLKIVIGLDWEARTGDRRRPHLSSYLIPALQYQTTQLCSAIISTPLGPYRARPHPQHVFAPVPPRASVASSAFAHLYIQSSMTQSDDVAATAPAAVARARLSAVMRNDYCRGRTADVGAQVGPFAMAHPVLSTCLTSRPMRQPRVRQIRSLFLSPSLVPWFGSLPAFPSRACNGLSTKHPLLCFCKYWRVLRRFVVPQGFPGCASRSVCPSSDDPRPKRRLCNCRRRLAAAAAAAGTEGREGRRRGERGGGWALGKRHTHSIPEGTQQPAQKKVEKPGSRGRRMCCHEPNAR